MMNSMFYYSSDYYSPHTNSHRQYPPYQYPPYHHPRHPQQRPQQQQQYNYNPYHYPPPTWTPTEYITVIRNEDVLSGRGGATNNHAGNRVFRSLVKKYQDRYIQAKKRDKPAVASEVVDEIRRLGGRFLKKREDTVPGQVTWEDIGEERAREKACQALREGAPELRRQKQQKEVVEMVQKLNSSTSTSSGSVTFAKVENHSVAATKPTTDEGSIEVDLHPSSNYKSRTDEFNRQLRVQYSDTPQGPLWIRPSSRLLPSYSSAETALDDLSEDDRTMYLRDFLPPCPIIRSSADKSTYWGNRK